jgi:hypothetical protein
MHSWGCFSQIKVCSNEKNGRDGQPYYCIGLCLVEKNTKTEITKGFFTIKTSNKAFHNILMLSPRFGCSFTRRS